MATAPGVGAAAPGRREGRSAAAAAYLRSQGLLEGRRWLSIRFVVDLLVVVVATWAGVELASQGPYAWLLAIYPPLVLVLLDVRGRYESRMRESALDTFAPGLGAVSTAAMATYGANALLSGDHVLAGARILLVWSLSAFGLTLAGAVLAGLHRAARRRGLVRCGTIVVGADAAGADIARRLDSQPEYGLRPLGFVDVDRRGGEHLRLPLLGGLGDLRHILEVTNARHVVVAFPEAEDDELLEVVNLCDRLGIQATLVPRLAESINSQTRYEHLGTVPVLSLRAIDTAGWRFRLKHALDRLFAIALLTILSPLLVVIAVAVKASSRGPVLFRQLRAGRDGQLYHVLKFRTMRPSDERDDEFVLPPGMAPGGVEGTDRRTPLGRALRRTSLDELPQLINVVRGEMSIVGPRPERPEYAELFRDQVHRYHDRHRVKSGITGWAQVNGLRGRSALADRVEFDNFYIEHWSLALDARILLLTVRALFAGK
jgi:exopolysaccharide biosynthesis polyprenyl glycosylphosphotransferase